MKKSFLTLISAFVALGMGYAQSLDGTIYQPTHVIGRRINASGEITKELLSDFSYLENGKLLRYEFPEYAVTAGYVYSGDYLMEENIFHQGGHPLFYETNLYTYENGQLKTLSHLLSQMGSSVYFVYDYYDDGRLARKDKKYDDDDDYHMHWLYEYEDEGKTVVESYYTSWVSQGMLLRQKTTKQYDDSFVLISSYTENYNESSELTSTEQTNYTYTPSGMLEKAITQTLTDGVWVNNAITQYAYDGADRIAEQLSGTWDAENNDWFFNRKITFETLEDELTYTVSFYKKNQDDWVWDTFNNQTVLFGSNLKAQQRALIYMVYEEMNGHGNINQLVFTLEEMNDPVYLGADENNHTKCCVYPNPGMGSMTVEAPVENAVIRFYNLQGQLMLARPFDFSTEISAESWPSGMYLWEIWHDSQKEACGKWVKE